MSEKTELLSGRFVRAVTGCFLIHLTLGTFYCWGNITPYVTSYMLWKGHDVNYRSTSFAFALTALSIGSFMSLGGVLQTYVGQSFTTLIGGWTLSLGVFLSAFSIKEGLVPFMATYAALFGFGIALAYTAPFQCLMLWLPERKGLATGLTMVGYGLGAFVFDPLQAAEANPHDLEPTLFRDDGDYYDWHDPEVQQDLLANVPGMFVKMASAYAIIQLIGSSLMCAPLRSDAGSEADGEATALLRKSSTKQHTIVEMLSTSAYWLLAINFFCNTQAAFFGISLSKTIANHIIPDSATDATLTQFAAMSSLFNASGRLLWGIVGDLFGFRCAMLCLCGSQAFLFLTLPHCIDASMYGVWLCGIMFCVGGNYSLFPLACASYFGEVNVGSNYGFLFFAQSVSMLLGPTISGEVLARYSPDILCYIVCAFTFLSVCLQSLPGSSN